MLHADISGMPSGQCVQFEALPVWQSTDGRSLTVAMKRVNENTRDVLSFVLNRDTDIALLSDTPPLVSAFDAVLAACKRYHDAIPAFIVQSADEALQARAEGRQLQCDVPLLISEAERRLLEDIQTRYHRFLELFEER